MMSVLILYMWDFSMDLKEELIILLNKAMDSKEYFNPTLIESVMDGIIQVYGEDAISDDLDKWSTNMWSR